jgi:hypothetical protein
LIVGTGTGGVNAIMIGRLGMSILQMKAAYRSLQNDVFQSIRESSYSYGDVSSHTALFDYKKLETWAKKLVKEYTEDEDARIMPDKKDNEWGNKRKAGCRVYVISISLISHHKMALD